MDIKALKQKVRELGDINNKKDLAAAILENLGSVPNKAEYQNILNSSIRESIKDLLIQRLPEKFDFDRFSFAETILEDIEKSEVLY